MQATLVAHISVQLARLGECNEHAARSALGFRTTTWEHTTGRVLLAALAKTRGPCKDDTH